ncbi:MAG: MFS transporter [Clostridiales bacterium]|nr:MFS transporter [Clostridiales bacterium]MCF8022339.1 MFS transporter [Clostridiales bacterium]
MHKEKASSKILLLAVLLLVVIMAFTGILNYMTFADSYNKSLVNTYSVAGNELVRKIEYALKYGKSIDNFYGMSDTLNELKVIVDEVEQVNIISPDGKVLYDLDGFAANKYVPEKLIKTAVFEQGTISDNCSYQSHAGKHHIFLKISKRDSGHAAALEMVFPGDVFMNLNNNYTKQLAAYAAGLVLLALVLLYIILFRTELLTGDNRVNRKRILITLVAVLGSVQLLYCGINYYLLKGVYGDLALQSKSFIENTVAQNIEGVYQKGISLEDVNGVKEYLGKIEAGLPMVKKVSVTEPGSVEGSAANSIGSRGGTSVNARISAVYIDRLMFRILLDMLTVWVISFFFMIELTLLGVIILSRQRARQDQHYAAREIYHAPGLIRGLTFIVNICVFLSITFVPIVMQNLYQPIPGLPRDVVLGLPISAEMLGGIMAIVLAGGLIDKKGWRTIFYTGALLLMAGNLFSGTASNAALFIFSRATAGLGIGFILMTLRSLAVSLPEKNIAIAEFSAGSIAGLNCGAVIGGMLADRIGYHAVFYLSAVMVTFVFVYVYKLMAGLAIEHRATSEIPAWNKLANFISDKNALVFLLLIFIPFFVAGAFMDYYFPLFAKTNSLTQSDISRAFLLNGLCVIYLGPVLTRYATRYLGDKKGMVISLFIVVCALAAFTLWGTIPAAFVTLILLGIAEGFGVAALTSYFLNLGSVRDLEINKAIAYFSVMVNASRMAGPIIFGVALSLGIRLGMGLITGGLLALLIAFIFISRFKPGLEDGHKNY